MQFTIGVLILLCLLHSTAMAEGFDQLDGRTQAYIIKQLSLALGDSDIAILQQRNDEWVRKDTSLSTGQKATLGLTLLRFIKMLKGTANVATNEIIYIYEPYNKEWHIRSDPRHGSPNRPPPYRPLFLAEDLMRLVLMKHQMEPIRDRFCDGWQKREPEIKPFVADALNMDNGKEFLAKYNLTTTFSNKVYRVMEGCVFRVDYPVPDMPETELMRMNRQNAALMKARVPYLQKMTNLVSLTKREVSEIVLLAYLLEGEKGRSQYAAMIKDNLLLEPMTELVFKTGIGRKLFAILGPKITGKEEK